MNKLKVFLVSLLLIGFIAISTSVFLYQFGLTAPARESEKNHFIVKAGTSNAKIVEDLAAAGLLRNKKAVLIYFRIHGDIVLQAGKYSLDKNMSAREIIKIISSGKITEDIVRLTFVEGRRLVKYVEQISTAFGYKERDILAAISNEEYLKAKIDQYWFLSDEILNKNLYYGLEGYIYPDTYQFYNDASIEDIFTKILNNTEQRLAPYRTAIENSGYTVHQILSMAAIIELEAVSEADRFKVSQVIYKRLASNMSLGVDVTTYYAVHKDMKDILTKSDIDTISPYNTRDDINMVAKLPVGPICNPSLMSINAALNPSLTNYKYFYADIKTGKVYFTEEYEDFLRIIKEIG